jgi:superfamily II DNA or RNA helicase
MTSSSPAASNQGLPQAPAPAVYHKCIGQFGYIVRKDRITKDQEKQLLDDLTVKTLILPAYKEFQKPKIYKIYFHSPTAYYIPRFYGIDTFGPPDYMMPWRDTPIKEGLKCLYNPLPHQKTVLEKARKIFDPIKPMGDGGVLSLPCGYGKTFCATKIVTDYLKLSALIIVPTECLMDQWMDAIREFVPGARVGYIQRDHVDVNDKDFVVAMLHSIALKDYDGQVFSRFGIVIYDECHHVGSEQFSKSMMKIRTRFILGLSATPNRRDGLSHVFYKFMGPLFHKEKRSGSNIVHVKKITLLSNSENYQVLRMSNGTTNTASMTTAISKLSERNALIVFCIRHLIQQGRKILLLSSRREHLTVMKEMLDAEGIKYPYTGQPVTYGFYYGKKGMTRQAHRALLSKSAKCDVVLGIDAIAKEGLDIPDLNTLIFATPSGMEVEQPVGRILRRFHEELNPMVIDLVDHTGNYVKHSKERDTWYQEEGYVIQNRTVSLDDASWTEMVQGYIHTKDPPPQATAGIVFETKPELDQCFLMEKGESRPSRKSAGRGAGSRNGSITGPSSEMCLLAAVSKKSQPVAHAQPDFSNLML